MDKQQTQYRRIPQVKMEDAHKLLKISKSEVSRQLDSSTTTQMAEIMVQYGRPSCSSWKEFYTVILWQDCYGKGNLRKSYWNMVGRKFQIGNVSLFIVKKDYSYLCMWDEHEIGWKENKTLIRCGNYSTKKSIWGEPTSFLDHVYFGLYSTTMRNKQRCLWTITGTMFESRISAGRSRETPIPLKIFVFLHGLLWHGWSCKRSVVERYCELANKTTQQLYNVSTPCITWPPLQRRRNKICWRIVKCMLSNCSKILILGTKLDDLIFSWSVN